MTIPEDEYIILTQGDIDWAKAQLEKNATNSESTKTDTELNEIIGVGSYGAVTSGGSNSSEPEHSVVPVGYVPGKGWLPGYETPSTGCLPETKDEVERNKDLVDRTNHPDIIAGLSTINYKLLSDQNTKGYTAGSERKYYQELFNDLKKDSNCNVFTRDLAVEGSPSAGFGIEIVTEYIFSYGGDIQLRVIDVNNDGKIDYVYKY